MHLSVGDIDHRLGVTLWLNCSYNDPVRYKEEMLMGFCGISYSLIPLFSDDVDYHFFSKMYCHQYCNICSQVMLIILMFFCCAVRIVQFVSSG